jgi:hypothetical protein
MACKWKPVAAFLLSALLIIGIPKISYGNSAAPPSIIIIVPNAPDDLEISIGSGDNLSKAARRDRVVESYFVFYRFDLKETKDYTLHVSTKGEVFDAVMYGQIGDYNRIYTLSLKNRTLVPGKLLWRDILLVSMRVLLTLAIEAAIFWLFGYRSRISWISFLVINLITQGWLNIWLNSYHTPVDSYVILSLIFGEFLVYFAEFIAFLAAVREKRPLVAFLYVLVANTLSLVAGGFLITVLPI